MRPPPAILSPGVQVLGYTVERQLGQGGFGTVYLARNAGQPFALKLLHLPRVGERAEREVSILLKLRHPNVVGLQGYGLWPPGEPRFAVIVMEYVDGRRLDVWADEENPTARQVAHGVLDVARALATTHAAGVLHRDVKEANVMVRASDGLAKLLDFGIGDYTGARGLTADILPPGTPEYRAPEAWRYFRQHARVPGARYVAGTPDDLWALGIVLYWLLTGRKPFDGASDTEFIEAVITQTPSPPCEVNERVPRALSDVCLRLLEKTPEARTPSALAVVAELEEVLRGADAAWDVPLCDAFGEDTATTESEQDSFEKWRNRPRHRPRRGMRAPLEASPLPAGATTTPETTVKPRRSLRAWAVVMTILALITVGVLLLRQEVAPTDKSPQSERAAVPSGPEATAAAVALPATLQEVAATVTTQTPETPFLPLSSKPVRKVRSVMTRAAGAAACTALMACPGSQVRPPPPPEPCPVGAVKAMTDRGIEMGDKYIAAFDFTGARIMSVSEGPAQFLLAEDVGDLPGGTAVSGRLIVRDRVYGRLTWATTKQGDSFPVCLEVYEEGGSRGRGMLREPGDDSPSSARVFTTVRVKAVREFE
ncbi:serine/threonine-protein kinase [Corallococcus aberystwythensis]|uniref:Serine/threonine protein kinase n=1 Tax=Corallococcus aberystwythensis TaxID=2316722 RepID=A0A3A8QSX1_9BACT|nr:serine/threonine-protein kinase [Corallococcus aberystwythensis]RKH71806.1 serine/threonine protein kinase [Corallococcus aberystwythensis]